MSDAMDEVYNDASVHIPEDVLYMIGQRTKALTIKQRSAEAVKRIFEAVDEDRRARAN